MVEFDFLEAVARKKPLLHCFPDASPWGCADLALAVGARPLSAREPEELEEAAALSDTAVLLMGAPTEDQMRGCLLCGQTYERLRKPFALDLTDVWAGAWRLRWTRLLLRSFKPSVVRVGLKGTLALLAPEREPAEARVPSVSAGEAADLARRLAERYKTVVLLTGPVDVISDGEQVLRVSGGSGRVTELAGTGALLSVLCGVFLTETEPLEAASLAASFWKLCAVRAAEEAEEEGPACFRNALLDAAYLLRGRELEDMTRK